MGSPEVPKVCGYFIRCYQIGLEIYFLNLNQIIMKSFLSLLCTGFAFLLACNQQTATNNNIAGNEMKKDTISCPPGSSKLDIQKIEQITGMKGAEKNGEYKITVPQNDLHVVV